MLFVITDLFEWSISFTFEANLVYLMGSDANQYTFFLGIWANHLIYLMFTICNIRLIMHLVERFLKD